MIDYNHLQKRRFHYLEGDITKIENYQQALSDTTQVWVCHHRRELVPDRKTIAELIELGLYWNRPPEELIFLTASDHMKLHSTGSNNAMFGKNSWDKCTPEEREDRAKRYSQSMKGKNSGKKFWTDGSKTVFCRECPPGFSKKHFVRSDETRAKLSKASKGRKLSEAARKKISDALRGRHLDASTKKKLSDALKGKKFTEEHRQRISEVLKMKRSCEICKKE